MDSYYWHFDTLLSHLYMIEFLTNTYKQTPITGNEGEIEFVIGIVYVVH